MARKKPVVDVDPIQVRSRDFEVSHAIGIYPRLIQEVITNEQFTRFRIDGKFLIMRDSFDDETYRIPLELSEFIKGRYIDMWEVNPIFEFITNAKENERRRQEEAARKAAILNSLTDDQRWALGLPKTVKW